MKTPSAWLIGTLAGIAGCVDTFGYMTLGHVFTSNMTGNTGAFAIYLVAHEWANAFHRGFPVLALLAGAFVGAALVETPDQRWRLSHGLIAEIVLLVGFVAFALRWDAQVSPTGPVATAGIAMLTIAMGIQNASLIRADGRRWHTTHVTGALTDFAQDAMRAWRLPGACVEPGRVGRLGARWIGFFAGGIAGALLTDTAGILTPLLPAGVLTLLLVKHLIAPFENLRD